MGLPMSAWRLSCRWAETRTVVPGIVAISAHWMIVATPGAAVVGALGETIATPSSSSVPDPDTAPSGVGNP